MLKISPSAIKTFRRCPRLIGFTYVQGLWPPSTVKQQFGTNIHKHLEAWLREAKVPDDSQEGQIAKAGISSNWLPTPGPHLLVECKFDLALEGAIGLTGIIDCVEPPAELPALVIDHKTTSDLRWAMTPEELLRDPQALIYAIWSAVQYDVSQVRVRWVYYAASNPKGGAPRKFQGVRPVENLISFSDPYTVSEVENLLEDVGQIAKIRERQIPGLELPANPAGCGMYGGCAFLEKCNLSGGDRLAAYLMKDQKI